MRALARKALVQLAGLSRSLSLYSPDHPRILELLDEFGRTLSAYFELQTPLIFDFDEGQVFHNEALLVDESLSCREFIESFEESGENRLIFTPNPSQAELLLFLNLTEPSAAREKTAERPLRNPLAEGGVEHIAVKKMRGRLTQESAEEKERTPAHENVDIYEKAVDAMAAIFENISDERSPLSKIKNIGRWVAKEVEDDHESMLALTALKSDGDQLCRHVLNVTLLAVALGKEMGLARPHLELLAEAALLHDVGKARVPAEIVTKPGPLTTEEWAIVARHPIDGAELIAGWEGASPIALVVAFEHHLGYDLSGYPTLRTTRELHLFSRITQIADAYDGLTSARAYHAQRTPGEVAELMLGPMSNLFDLRLLRMFFRLIGIYPIGSLLRLNTGNFGLVRGVDRDNPLRPIMRLIDLPTPKTVELARYPTVEIVEFIDPRAAGVDLTALLKEN